MTNKAVPENLGDQFFKGESVFFKKGEEQSNNDVPKQEVIKPAEQTVKQSVAPVIESPINQPANQSINSPINTSQVLAKPKGFYITEKQDDDLDVAAKKLADKMKGRLTNKIDRSTILRLIIEHANITNDETIEKLASQLTSQLIRQLTG